MQDEGGSRSSGSAIANLTAIYGLQRQTTGKNWGEQDTKTAFVNLSSFDGAKYGKVDSRAFNLGSTLIQELRHAATGEQDLDNGVFRLSHDWTGPVVDFVNTIRAARNLPIRASYAAAPTVFGHREKLGFKHVYPKRPEKVEYVTRKRFE